MIAFNESTVELATIAWLRGIGWITKHGDTIAPDAPGAEREHFGQVVLEQRLRDAIARLNPSLPAQAREDAFRKVSRPDGVELAMQNRDMHRLLVNGVTVEYRDADGHIRGAQAQIINFDRIEDNDWLAVNQFAVIENKHSRRPDVVLFVNGLPLAVVELKNAADQKATVWTAFQQLQTYMAQIPSLFAYNALMIASDGTAARVGTITSGKEWYKPWRTVAGQTVADKALPQIQVMIEGLFDRGRFLDMIRDFIVFEDNGNGTIIKKMAGYHQFHAVQVAVTETLRAAELRRALPLAADEKGRYESGARPGGKEGDQRVGVVWHTQGSGKSLTMAFYAGRIIREPAMQNPTVVVITDRNDLDNQLFGMFSLSKEILRQPPVQAESRAHLRELLSVASGGVVFTTVQKFFPDVVGDRHDLLSERHNIVVIADEAHRSQYAFIKGFARHMRDALPHASFIGFTGTPIELQDANTRAVFGEYISVYDIQQAVFDESTVPIYYESRHAKLALDEAIVPTIDPDFEEVTEGEEVDRKEALKTRWAQLEAIVGSDKRIAKVAADIVAHFEIRLESMVGKAMIVCMSRRICADLYNEIIKLRPEWHGTDDDEGILKVVMTGSASDPLDWQQHIRSKPRRETLANRFRDPKDKFQIVIVRDMWLTGFDAPSLHTMYIDKPMKGHGLMQAIARVNRVFKNKPGGLVVDYLGLAQELKKALSTYTESGGEGATALDQDVAVAVMLEKYEVCCGIFHGFDRSKWLTGAATERVSLLTAAYQFVLAQESGKERLRSVVRELSQAFALSVPHAETMRVRDEVAFFQSVQAGVSKLTDDDDDPNPRSEEDIAEAVRGIISHAVAPEGVIDIFAAAGLKRPDISILSEEFLAEVRDMPQRNVAVELLRKLLKAEIAARRRTNVVQARSFAEMLAKTIHGYTNRAVEAAAVIEELIALAKEMREAAERGVALGLNDDELAFYDALETNDSAVKVLGDDALRMIARELVDMVRKNVTIDWTFRENVRANMRVMVKRILRKYGYPPDKAERATQTVLEQAALLSAEWAE